MSEGVFMNSDEKKVVQLEVDKKNTAAVTQALEDIRKMQYEQQEKINGLLATLSTINQRMLDLEQMVRVQKAMMFGNGPSVRS
jgi:hypothetical protein